MGDSAELGGFELSTRGSGTLKSHAAPYFPRLDHLRFIAALMVLFWHSLHYGNAVPASVVPTLRVLSLFEEGHTGVALFITLSGFLFAALTDGKDVEYLPFVRSRLLRIAPLFVLWTLVTFHTTDVQPERLLAVLLSLLDRGSYPHAGWTVLVEFQIYLIFPFLLRFSRIYGLRYLVGVVAIAALIRCGAFLVKGSAQHLGYWTVFGRIDQFIAGMLWFVAYKRFSRLLGSWLVFPAGTTLLVLLYHEFNRRGGYYHYMGNSAGSPVWIYLPTLEGIGYGFVISSYLAWRVKVPRVIDRSLAWLGSLSYSLYLNHQLLIGACFTLAARRGIVLQSMEQFTVFTLLVILPVLLATSTLTYYVIEVPFLKLRRAYAQALPTPESAT